MGGCTPSSTCLLSFYFIRHYTVGEVCPWIAWSSILLGIFHQALLLFFFFFFSTNSRSSGVKCLSLMSNGILIIPVISSWITLGEFPSKFSKYCFHSCIRSSWLEVFSFVLAVPFLLLTPLTVCHANLNCLSSTESLVLLIWFST